MEDLNGTLANLDFFYGLIFLDTADDILLDVKTLRNYKVLQDLYCIWVYKQYLEVRF